MLKELCESMISLICDLSLDTTVNTLGETLEKKRLSDRIDEQIERYKKDILMNLGEDEWFDFIKVNQYIKEHLFDKVTACFNLPEEYQRDRARKNLIEIVYNEAGADTTAKKKAVYHYIQIFFQIINFYYLDKIDGREWFLAGKTVEEIKSFVEKYIKETENKIVKTVQYHGSFAEYIDGIMPPPDNENILHYRNELLRFRGRETEMEMLQRFVEDDEKLLWMAVTGPGGVGKSKLLYHFVKGMEIYPEWKSIWIYSEHCEQFLKYNEWRYPYNLLVIIDYAGIMASDIGKWLERLERSRYRPDKVRFVFIEREMVGENGNIPFWYQNLKGKGEQERCVERLTFKKYNGMPFLQLSELDRTQMKNIIEDYAELQGKVLSDHQKDWILEKAEEIDQKQGYARILIVLFTADAVLQGREYKNWDIQYLVSEIIKRYSIHWETVICQNNKEIFDALLEMLMFATVVGSWKPEEEVPELLENSSAILCSMDASDLEQLICEINEEIQFDGKLNPMEPDLIGEYYVLDYWRKKKYAKDYLENMFNILWEYPWEFAHFIDRCIQNYAKENVFEELFQNGMERLIPSYGDEIGSFCFSILLVNLSYWQEEREAKKSIGRLEELSRRYEKKEEFALQYAKGLVNLSYEQEEIGAEKSIRRLKELSGRYEGNEEIALCYAQGLFNLSNKQEEMDRKESIGRLEELSGRYKGNGEIALEYAKGLFNLSNKQEEIEAEKTIERLEELSERYEGNEEIALEYAKGLFNLSNKQEEIEAEKTIERLEELSGRYEGNGEIILLYAQGLVNLSAEQEEKDGKKTIGHLEKLSGKYEGNGEIALCYAQGLVNLSNNQEEKGAEKTIECLEELSERYEGNEEIALVYAQGLVNLSNEQEEIGAEKTIERLKELNGRYEENGEIALEYAKGLFNLSNKQEEIGVEKSIGCLKKLSERYEGNEEIALCYAQGLFNLLFKQEEIGTKESIGCLKKLSERYEGNEEIALEYAKGLVFLSFNQEENDRKNSIKHLEELSRRYEESEEIALLYAYLFNL